MIDELSINADGQSVRGWQEISLTRSIEGFPSNFDVGMTERFPGSSDTVVIVPGRPCTVTIGDDLVLTGYVDTYNSQITAQTHDVRMAGRSKCEDLVDCSAFFGVDGNGNTPIENQTITQIATALAEPFGITVTNRAEDGPPIQLLVINLGETPYEIIEKCARWVGLLVHDDVDGNLILERVGANSMASGFQQGKNVQAASVTYRTDQRFTDYYTVWQAVNQMRDVNNATNLHGFAEDVALKKLGRYRPHYIVSALVDASQIVISGTADLGQKIADWECNRRFGRSQSITLVADSWRDKNGTLWTPNSFATIDVPAIKCADKTWVISTVVYQRNLSTGTTAQLTLMPKEAFSIEPISLLPENADLIAALRDGGNGGASP